MGRFQNRDYSGIADDSTPTQYISIDPDRPGARQLAADPAFAKAVAGFYPVPQRPQPEKPPVPSVVLVADVQGAGHVGLAAGNLRFSPPAPDHRRRAVTAE